MPQLFNQSKSGSRNGVYPTPWGSKAMASSHDYRLVRRAFSRSGGLLYFAEREISTALADDVCWFNRVEFIDRFWCHALKHVAASEPCCGDLGCERDCVYNTIGVGRVEGVDHWVVRWDL